MGAATATRTDVARLYARAAFGATAADLDAWTGKPYAAVVDHLLDAQPEPVRSLPNDLKQKALLAHRTLGAERNFDIGYLRHAQGWWLERMRLTAAPLLERMTLVWHGHFATARKSPYPDTGMLLGQNEAQRAHALGSFADLVLAMTTDAAMLWWLDGTVSAHPAPNENYARELFELFTMGKRPQRYAEADIREAARALTGWVADGFSRDVAFDPVRHDPGRKHVLGIDIANQGEREFQTVVAAALGQEVSRRFIADKLVRDLAFDLPVRDVMRRPDPLVVRVAEVLARTGWSIRAAVREVLLSDEFRDQRRRRVRQPVEMVVHAAKALDVSTDDDALLRPLIDMGQEVFQPANVGGWPHGEQWFSPAATLARYRAAVRLHQAAANAPFASLPAAKDLAGWTDRLGLASLSAPTIAAVRSFLGSDAIKNEADLQAGVLVLLLTSPDWAVV